jgi:hypothetical protein
MAARPDLGSVTGKVSGAAEPLCIPCPAPAMGFEKARDPGDDKPALRARTVLHPSLLSNGGQER